jgi:hypothetical protein
MDVADTDAKAITPVIRRNVNLKLVIFNCADAHRSRYFLKKSGLFTLVSLAGIQC